MYSSFIPVQPFMSSTVRLPSSSVAIIGPKVFVIEKVSSGIHFGLRYKLLQLSLTSRSLTPEVQCALRKRLLHWRWRIRKLVRPHLEILHTKIKIFQLLIFLSVLCSASVKSYAMHLRLIGPYHERDGRDQQPPKCQATEHLALWAKNYRTNNAAILPFSTANTWDR